jgi:hypothetical protein
VSPSVAASPFSRGDDLLDGLADLQVRRRRPISRRNGRHSRWPARTRIPGRADLIFPLMLRMRPKRPRRPSRSERKMKTSILATSTIATCALLIGIVPGRAQNDQSGAGNQTSDQPRIQNQTSRPSRPGNPRMRVPGAPRIQPSPGLGVECTPIDQRVVGAMLGPSDLCDR